MTTVLIADDHPWTRSALREALERDGFYVCAEAADASQAVEAALRHRPQLCLLDINMPGNGISAAGRITGQLPETTVVMLTVSRHDTDLLDALRAGATSYLVKGGDESRIGDSLRRALAGETTLPRSMVARLTQGVRDPISRQVPVSADHAPRLTDREWEVLEFMRQGLTTSEMAERLFVSRSTIRSHISRVFHKLKVTDREAAVKLLERGSVPGSSATP